MDELKKLRPKRLKGAEWFKAYHNGDRLTQIAMLSHALWVHHVASYNYGYLSYLYDYKWIEYKSLLDKVNKIKREIEK